MKKIEFNRRIKKINVFPSVSKSKEIAESIIKENESKIYDLYCKSIRCLEDEIKSLQSQSTEQLSDKEWEEYAKRNRESSELGLAGLINSAMNDKGILINRAQVEKEIRLILSERYLKEQNIVGTDSIR